MERITVVRPGNDRVPTAQGGRGGAPHLLSVGAVVPRKGFDVLVGALARLTDLEWRLTIAGDLTRDPATAERLQADIARHGLTSRVATPGAVSSQQLAALYDSADLFVLASRFEGYGMAYAEALAHGLPVIGTKAGAIPDTIPHDTGLLVDAGDVAGLADAVRRTIVDRRLRQEMSEAALAAARQLPTWPQSAAIFAAALEALT
jgi:glycosyltransferase involved in cell wall biosynthesis